MNHTCHHPHCEKPVPPKMLACRAHWYQLPLELRNAVWRTYRPGQEVTKTPSQAYMDVIAQVQRYWKDALQDEKEVGRTFTTRRQERKEQSDGNDPEEVR